MHVGLLPKTKRPCLEKKSKIKRRRKPRPDMQGRVFSCVSSIFFFQEKRIETL